MSPDPVALRIAAQTGRGYNNVRLALRTLEGSGWDPSHAAAWVWQIADTQQGRDLVAAAREVANRGPSPDVKEKA